MLFFIQQSHTHTGLRCMDQIWSCSSQQNSSLCWTLCGVTSAVFRLWILKLFYTKSQSLFGSFPSLHCCFIWLCFPCLFLLTHHRPMDVPECPLLAVQNLPLCLVLLSVDPVNMKMNEMSHSCREHMPLKYQVKGNKWDTGIKSHTFSNTHAHTHIHNRQASLENQKLKSVDFNLSARLTKQCLDLLLVGAKLLHNWHLPIGPCWGIVIPQVKKKHSFSYHLDM